ncbi:hypothetical protein [Cupriavidus plantarum]|uniref:hypothetical protein n=1 Tax=Cupriavidus plantarum TaxID=942865 RepID=UPI00339D318B
MPRPARSLVVAALFVTASGLLAPLPMPFHHHSLAQGPSAGDAAINNAISNAVREGEPQFRPTPSQPPSRDAECDSLAAQIGDLPRRSYRPSGQNVENSQGTDIPTVERDRTRRQLQRVYSEKCAEHS